MSNYCDRCVWVGYVDPVVWRCPECGHSLCADCLFSEIDCYDLARQCPSCDAALPDSDGSGPVDWKALGYAVTQRGATA